MMKAKVSTRIKYAYFVSTAGLPILSAVFFFLQRVVLIYENVSAMV